MPFRSKAQQGYLYVHLPEIAKRFASETPKEDYEKMPEHVKRARTKPTKQTKERP